MVGANRIPSEIAAAHLIPSQVDALWYSLSQLDTPGDGTERPSTELVDHAVIHKIVQHFGYSLEVRIVSTPAVRVNVSAYYRVSQR